MSRYYVKSLKEYNKPIKLDDRSLLDAMKRVTKGRRKPTSIALEESTIRNLKGLAKKNGIPYQVLMRMFILDGLRRLEVAA